MTGPEYRAARLALGLSRDQLAARLNIGRRTVERIEAEGCTVVMGLAMERLAEMAKRKPIADQWDHSEFFRSKGLR